jgi:hypothetical protein
MLRINSRAVMSTFDEGASLSAAGVLGQDRDRAPLLNTRRALLVGFEADGSALLDMCGPLGARGVEARSCVFLSDADIGRDVVVVTDADKPESFIVIGVVQPVARPSAVEVVIDGRALVLRGEESITLKCGEASVSLNRDGKIVIRGKHVVTHASGVNRIRGASVELN